MPILNFKSAHRFATLTVIPLVMVSTSCRQVKELPEGETPTGKKLDPTLPKDARLLSLFESVKIVDDTKSKNYAKCTRKEYIPDPNTNQFPATASSESSDSYEYDAKGNKIKETSTTQITEWSYDSSSRITALKISNLRTGGGATTVYSNCKVSYDGDSFRVTKYECFNGSGTAETDLNRVTEISYNLAEKKRTITKKSKSGSPVELRVETLITEEHTDTDFSFPISREETEYDYISGIKITSQSETWTVSFNNNLFYSTQLTKKIYKNDQIAQETEQCTFATGVLNCTTESKNFAGEVYEKGTSIQTPILYKRRQSDTLDSAFISNFDNASFNFIELKSTTTKIEGKLDRDGRAVAADFEEITNEYDSQSRFIKGTAYGVNEGKHSDYISTRTFTEDSFTTIDQRRKNSDQATSRADLGDFENDSKREYTCSM